MTTANITRERWLTNACDHILTYELDPITLGQFPRPHIRISVGFLKGGRTRIGGCYPRAASSQKYNEIFITPTLDNTVKILGVLVHELIHATDDCESGHKGFFRKTAKTVGLTGKMTATTMGDDLTGRMLEYMDQVGRIPHAKMTLTNNAKKQTTRMLKLTCKSCGFVARTTAKWADKMDPDSICPCCNDHSLNKG